MDLIGRLIPPKKIDSVPKTAQWLPGEGGGAWFFIQKEESQFRIQRFTPQGIMDCDRVFQPSGNSSSFEPELKFEVKHISHCAKVQVSQAGKNFTFLYNTK